MLFYFLSVMSNGAVNILVQGFVWMQVFHFSQVVLLVHMVLTCSIL